jgi:hypothetical protein
MLMKEDEEEECGDGRRKKKMQKQAVKDVDEGRGKKEARRE